jgi:hypothetical protein
VSAAVGEEAVWVELEALDHVGLAVSDVSRSVRWYLPGPGGHQVEITTYEPAPG